MIYNHETISHVHGKPQQLDFLFHLESVLSAKGALDIRIVPLLGKTDISDYMIIASGTSSRHVSSLADYVAEAMVESGLEVLSIEGKESGEWVLIDNATAVVHLFKPEIRERFNLEGMWSEDFSDDEEPAEIIGH